MRRTLFNDGWEVQPEEDQPPRRGDGSGGRVGRGHPAPRRHDRHRAVPAAGPATGYFPGGIWEYRRTFGPRRTSHDVVARVRGRVPRCGRVGERHGRRAPALRATPTSSSRSTTCCTGARTRSWSRPWRTEDSRWYSGAGIHRASGSSAARCTSRPTAQVSTPEVDDGGAVVTVTPSCATAAPPPPTASSTPRSRRRRRRSSPSDGPGHHVPRRRGRGAAAPLRRRPARWSVETRTSTPAADPAATATRPSTRTPRPSASARSRSTPARPAHQRRAGQPPRRVHPPRQRRARRGHHRPGRRAPGRAAQGRGLQRPPQRAPPA